MKYIYHPDENGNTTYTICFNEVPENFIKMGGDCVISDVMINIPREKLPIFDIRNSGFVLNLDKLRESVRKRIEYEVEKATAYCKRYAFENILEPEKMKLVSEIKKEISEVQDSIDYDSIQTYGDSESVKPPILEAYKSLLK